MQPYLGYPDYYQGVLPGRVGQVIKFVEEGTSKDYGEGQLSGYLPPIGMEGGTRITDGRTV